MNGEWTHARLGDVTLNHDSKRVRSKKVSGREDRLPIMAHLA